MFGFNKSYRCSPLPKPLCVFKSEFRGSFTNRSLLHFLNVQPLPTRMFYQRWMMSFPSQWSWTIVFPCMSSISSHVSPLFLSRHLLLSYRTSDIFLSFANVTKHSVVLLSSKLRLPFRIPEKFPRNSLPFHLFPSQHSFTFFVLRHFILHFQMGFNRNSSFTQLIEKIWQLFLSRQSYHLCYFFLIVLDRSFIWVNLCTIFLYWIWSWNLSRHVLFTSAQLGAITTLETESHQHTSTQKHSIAYRFLCCWKRRISPCLDYFTQSTITFSWLESRSPFSILHLFFLQTLHCLHFIKSQFSDSLYFEKLLLFVDKTLFWYIDFWLYIRLTHSLCCFHTWIIKDVLLLPHYRQACLGCSTSLFHTGISQRLPASLRLTLFGEQPLSNKQKDVSISFSLLPAPWELSESEKNICITGCRDLTTFKNMHDQKRLCYANLKSVCLAGTKSLCLLHMSKEHKEVEEKHSFRNFQSSGLQKHFQEAVVQSRNDSLRFKGSLLPIFNRFLAKQELQRRALEEQTILQWLIDAAQSCSARNRPLIHDAELQEIQNSKDDPHPIYCEESIRKKGEGNSTSNIQIPLHIFQVPIRIWVHNQAIVTAFRHSGSPKRSITLGSYTRAQFLQNENEEFNQVLDKMEYHSRDKEANDMARFHLSQRLEFLSPKSKEKTQAQLPNTFLQKCDRWSTGIDLDDYLLQNIQKEWEERLTMRGSRG